MRTLGSVAAVIAAMRDEVGGDVDKLARDAENQLARLQEDEALEPVALPDREARLAAARREARERLAREDWQGTREALEEREKWIDRVVAEGGRKLAEPEEIGQRRRCLAQLARDGLERLPGSSFEVVVSAPDAAILDASWCREVAAGDRWRVRLAVDGVAASGGCIIRTADGRASFDNTFQARSQRLQSAWRAALGEIYES